MSIADPINAGNYTAQVSPDVNYWTFTQPWGTGSHKLLKQEIEGDSWDYSAGGVRVDDSTTMTFFDLSNYALAYAKNGPLPLAVELVSFEVRCTNNGNLLSWITATESHSHSFIIERSINGSAFEVVGIVGASIQSAEANAYSFMDKDRSSQDVYYRLSEKNMDGEVQILRTSYLDCSEEAIEIEVFPNPTNNIINLSVSVSEPGEMNIRFYTAAGAQADEVKGIHIRPGTNLYTIRNIFSPGVYLLVVELNGEQITKRIIVN